MYANIIAVVYLYMRSSVLSKKDARTYFEWKHKGKRLTKKTSPVSKRIDDDDDDTRLYTSHRYLT